MFSISERQRCVAGAAVEISCAVSDTCRLPTVIRLESLYNLLRSRSAAAGDEFDAVGRRYHPCQQESG